MKVPFDVDHWREVAEEAGPLPEPWSDDPTQWLFEGRPEVSTAPLQVAVARLVGYRWPEQAESDDLDAFADADGIVCLPSVAGEAPAADRVQQVLAAAFGEGWSPAKVKELLEQAGSKKKNLADWLRDEFFKQHCALFGNRPFVWHIWDGQRDGFSALVNYHRLDRKTLEKLTYTYLGQDWVERQRAEVRDEVAGAEARLSAALGLQRKLEAILEGEAPYDIYVRWKEAHEQPVGWEPDLNDGVRLNIRPFVEAGVLRAPFNIHWRKDRGKNPDGSERENDIHLTARREARGAEGAASMSEQFLTRRRVRRGCAGCYDPNVRVAPVALLWPDEGAQWEQVIDRVGEHLPVVSLGEYDPAAQRGPAYWIRCVVAGTSTSAFRRAADRVPPGCRSERPAGRRQLPTGAGADRRAAVPQPVVLPSEQPRLDCPGAALAH